MEFGQTFGKLGGAAIQGLFKEISGSLQLLSPITVNELCKVGVPNVIHIGPPEESDATLIGLKKERSRSI